MYTGSNHVRVLPVIIVRQVGPDSLSVSGSYSDFKSGGDTRLDSLDEDLCTAILCESLTLEPLGDLKDLIYVKSHLHLIIL